MAQKRKNKSKKWIFWILLAVVFVVAGVVAYFVGRTFFKDQAGILEPENQTEQIEESSMVEIEDGQDNTDDEDADMPESKVKQFEGGDPNKLPELTGVINRINVNENGVLEIRADIAQYLSNGTCELIMQQDGATIYNNSAVIVPLATTSTCDGFDVPVSQLGAGNYQIIINMSAGEKTGTLTGEVAL